jgi:rubrerythrin
MHTDPATEILKNAILLETRGRAFYRTVARQAENAAVKDFFETMAAEEDDHVRILSNQFKAYHENGKFLPEPPPSSASRDLAAEILNQDTAAQISAADFEAAAVSAAMAMEKRAIELYAGRADSAQDPAEKALYQWLADWEKTHLDFLAQVDRALTEKIWNDNQFWPF